MIYRKDDNVYCESSELEKLFEIVEEMKTKYGHNDALYKEKTKEWFDNLPEEK